jgi:phosphotransferase system enzyme I (PtsP)
LRKVDLNEVRKILDASRNAGDASVRRAVADWLAYQV